ncbi:hypothetical protein D1007_19676 [Hordeum vulgare]|nr:hypothetical protein D1007_19676 [Hordeum vulgare]
MQKLPAVEHVKARAPDGEHVSSPRPGEHVAFATHFLIGFGLPASRFMQNFLESYGLQMHHLVPNSVLYLACFSTLCEAYLVFWAFPSFFGFFFHVCCQMHDDVPYSCGDTVVYRWRERPFRKMKWVGSFKKWQHSFLYVHNIGVGRDWVILVPMANVALTRDNWSLKVRNAELLVLKGRLRELVSSQGLMPSHV